MEHSSINISGIQCDNPSCDYKDMSVRFEDYVDWLNRPCPKCGDNLLTQESLDQCQALVEAVELANEFSPDDIRMIQENMSPEEMDRALDFINDMGLKKIGEDAGGGEIWTTKKDEDAV
jgi:hypothetical protein